MQLNELPPLNLFTPVTIANKWIIVLKQRITWSMVIWKKSQQPFDVRSVLERNDAS